jgi:hypothetical protein
MPINPKFITTSCWNAIAYIILILFLLARNIWDIKLNGLAWQVLGLINQLLLILLFIFVVEVLRRANEKPFIVISYSLYPVITALSAVIFSFFKVSVISPVMVTLGALAMIININLFIQSFRLKKSPVRIGCRMVAITVFVILLIKQSIPVLFAFVFPFDQSIYMSIIGWASLVDLALYIFVPINVILMIRKLNGVQTGGEDKPVLDI